MKRGKKPATDLTGGLSVKDLRERLSDLIQTVFPPGGISPRDKMDLEAWLEIAKSEGIDPEALYAEAVSQISDPERALPYAEVAPR